MNIRCYFQVHLFLFSLFQHSANGNDLADWQSRFFPEVVGHIFSSDTGDRTFASVTLFQNFVESREVCLSNGAKLTDYVSREVQNRLRREELVPPLEIYCVWMDSKDYFDENFKFIDTPGIRPLRIVDNTTGLLSSTLFDCIKMCVDDTSRDAYWVISRCFDKAHYLCEIITPTPEAVTKAITQPTKPGKKSWQNSECYAINLTETSAVTTTTELLTTPNPTRTLSTKQARILWMVRVEERQNFKFTSSPDWSGRAFTSATCARHCQKHHCVTFTYCPESKLCDVYVNNPPDEYEPAACDIWVPKIG